MQFDNELDFENKFDEKNIFIEPINKAYDDFSIEFLSDISKSLLKDKSARSFPDLITFAFFCRKSNLLNFKKLHLDQSIDKKRYGWGVCLHIAPANIPMNFAFSFIMGFLSGNKNIVRLPSKRFEQIDIFIKHFTKIVSKEIYKSLINKNFFVRTDRDSKKLITIVKNTDAIVVWGGDDTVKNFREFEKKPTCIEAYFPNRSSSLIIDCDKFVEKDASDLEKFCINFFNDTYLVDQNACSSPSVIYWYSQKNKFDDAKLLFTNKMNNFLDKAYDFETTLMIEKYIDVLRSCDVIESSIKIEKAGNKLWYLTTDQHKLIKTKLGVFVTKNLTNLSDLPKLIRHNEQTLTYSDINYEEITNQFSGKSFNSIDRVIEIGKALDIGLIWDGKNMITTLSKYINAS